MFLAALIFITALAMEAIGTYISVIGLSAIFAGDWVIIAMAMILDVAKLVSVSFLYQTWKDVSKIMKAYMLSAVVVLMIVTSAGAFGYLSNQVQKAISPQQTSSIELDAAIAEKNLLSSEKISLLAEKSKLDAQIANLPADQVRSRTRLLSAFKEDYSRIRTRLAAIEPKIGELTSKVTLLQTSSVTKATEIGPLLYLAKITGASPEEASKWIILILILVFDPLAIALVVAGNFLLKRRKANQVVPTIQEEKVPEEPEAPNVSQEEDKSETSEPEKASEPDLPIPSLATVKIKTFDDLFNLPPKDADKPSLTTVKVNTISDLFAAGESKVPDSARKIYDFYDQK